MAGPQCTSQDEKCSVSHASHNPVCCHGSKTLLSVLLQWLFWYVIGSTDCAWTLTPWECLLLFIAAVDCSSRTTLFWCCYFLESRFLKEGLRADISDTTFLTLPIRLLLNNWHTGWRVLRSTMNDCGEEKVGEEKIYAKPYVYYKSLFNN